MYAVVREIEEKRVVLLPLKEANTLVDQPVRQVLTFLTLPEPRDTLIPTGVGEEVVGRRSAGVTGDRPSEPLIARQRTLATQMPLANTTSRASIVSLSTGTSARA
jgi:hypothetical protein